MTTNAYAPKATVLVVDDDWDILRFVAHVLRGEGYTIIEAQDPAHAVAVCADPQSEIDLLLSDYWMPGMNGMELGIVLREFCPNLPIMFMSGDRGAEKRLAADGFACLRKPFTSADLAATIKQILETS